jgi:Ca2+/Na+ antiporter
MNQPPILPFQSPLDQKPRSRGERLGILIEDILIVLSVVLLFWLVMFRPRGTLWTVGMYAALVAMVVVAVRRFARIRKASKTEDKG